jgi:hypothetical protein
VSTSTTYEHEAALFGSAWAAFFLELDETPRVAAEIHMNKSIAQVSLMEQIIVRECNVTQVAFNRLETLISNTKIFINSHTEMQHLFVISKANQMAACTPKYKLSKLYLSEIYAELHLREMTQQ